MGFSELDSFVQIYGIVLMTCLGAVFGSFLNCMAARRVTGESVLRGRSHCDSCGHVLGPLDLIPVFSWLFLKGRCRYCGAKVPARDLVSELIMGAAFLILWVRFGLQWETLIYAALTCILMELSLNDLDTMEIPDGCIVAGMIVWIPSLILFREPWKDRLLSGLAGGLVIAGALLLLSLLFDRVTGRDSLGGGDIKLFFMTGLYTGLAGGLLTLILACVLGLVFAACHGTKGKAFPFGPAIALAAYLELCFGSPLIRWYLGLFA